jgi:hypothetical protein
MNHFLPKRVENLFPLVLWLLVILACKPSGTSTTQQAPTPPPPPSNFNFAVSVRDRNRNNRPVGQSIVLLEVGNETVAQEVTDDNGQANFSVSGYYLGKTARLFAKAYNYHSADVSLTLRNDIRQTIQLISADFPTLDPEPVEPSPPPGVKTSRSPKQQETRPELEIFAPGESKTGAIADRQVIDYRFEADKNVPLIFTGRISDGSTAFSVEIYNSQGFPQDKDMYVDIGTGEKSLPFTPPQTGPYILRIRGRYNFGRYLVSMREL